MWQVSYYLYAIVFAICCSYRSSASVTSVFPDRTRQPGLNSPQKLWWAKEITPDFHVAGRLSGRQIKYAAEAGFKSVLSLFKYGDDEPGDFGGDYLPTSKESKEIANKEAGIQFTAVLRPAKDDWCSVAAVRKFAKLMPKLRKPALLHCDRGYTISFVTLMHLANLTRYDPNFTPKINSARFYEITAAMGLDFTMDFTKEVVAEITGEPLMKNPPIPDVVPEDWLDYWVAHPVYKNWYIAGQITKSHIPVLEFSGFKSVINVRPDIHLEGMPSQEEVNLLNIQDQTGSYATQDKMPRQSKEHLEETRIRPNKPNSYIGKNSPVNYESENPDEFGDSVGYNQSWEKKAFKKSSLKYYHLPHVDSLPYQPFFEKYNSEIAAAGKSGPVLVHSSAGRRAAYVAIVGAAQQHGKDLNWALEKSQDLGFEVSPTSNPDIYNSFKVLLGKLKDPKKYTKEEL